MEMHVRDCKMAQRLFQSHYAVALLAISLMMFSFFTRPSATIDGVYRLPACLVVVAHLTFQAEPITFDLSGPPESKIFRFF